jgi:hypothetical protein
MKRIIAVAAVVLGLLTVTIPARASTDHWLANKTAARAWGDPRFDLVMGSLNAVAAGHANVSKFYSYRAFRMSNTTAPIVLYDIEHKRSGVPIREERHPRKFMKAFVALAHARGKQAILAPGKSLGDVPGADCPRRGETPLHNYLRCHRDSVATDYVLLQAQNIECDANAFEGFVRSAIRSAQAPVLVELTVLFQTNPCVTAPRISRAWSRVQGIDAVRGFALWSARDNGLRSWADQVGIGTAALARIAL